MGVPVFEFLEGVGHPIQRIAGGDVEIDRAAGYQVGDLGEHFRCGRVGAAFSLGADFARLLERDDRVDALRCHSQIHG